MDSAKIGSRIKTYRKELGLTVEELAGKAGLDMSFVQAIEEGRTAPALGPMVKLSGALGVRLGTFTDDIAGSDPLISRKSSRAEDTAVHASGEKKEHMSYHHLGKGKVDRNMEPFFICLAPLKGDPEMSSHEGEEFVVVVRGEVILHYGTEVHTLTAGDSMYYNSVVPHHVGAKGPHPAEIYAVLYVPA